MAASPEFYKPPAPFASPCASPLPAGPDDGDYYYGGSGSGSGSSSSYSCRTPTGSGISYLKEPTTCPPAPRKPLCKKRLFHDHSQKQEVPLISLRLDELERIFRPQQQPPANKQQCDKRRRSARNQRDPPPSQNSLRLLDSI